MQSISFKETQIKNDGDSMVMRGFPVSSGSITAKASVILGPAEFDNMIAGSILVSPLTTPAWTQLFANAVGLVTDVVQYSCTPDLLLLVNTEYLLCLALATAPSELSTAKPLP